jgi:hypothetical protein
MAVGFRISEVLSIDVDDEEPNSIIFTTRGIRYKIIFDDQGKRKEIISLLQSFRDKPAMNEKKRDRPKFYLEKNEKGEETEKVA